MFLYFGAARLLGALTNDRVRKTISIDIVTNELPAKRAHFRKPFRPFAFELEPRGYFKNHPNNNLPDQAGLKRFSDKNSTPGNGSG